MYFCPKCNVSLKRVKGVPGIHWVCTTCDSRSSMIALLRKTVPTAIVNNLWKTAKTGKYPRHRECPACNNLMAEIPVAVPDGIQSLDVCTVCQFVWFDKGEFKTLPDVSNGYQNQPPLSDEAREKLARWELEKLKEKERMESANSGQPVEDWHSIPGFFGLPVEIDAKAVNSKPIITWGVTALVTIASVIAFFNLRNTIDNYGLVPENCLRYGGLTFFTSFLIHAGVIHLLGNMYFLFVFGDNVEDWLGSKRFVFLLLLSIFVGDVAHILVAPNSTVPCIGASGGISGVLTFYALKFPHVRLGIFLYFPNRFYLKLRSLGGYWVQFPAYLLFFIWVVLQIFGVWLQVKGYSNVSSLAHLGGAIVGFVFWFVTRNE